MDNPEKLATWDTKTKKKQNKNTDIVSYIYKSEMKYKRLVIHFS